MAYLSKEQVKEIRENIKKAFPNFKFSINRHHYSGVNIHLMKGSINFGKEYQQVNQYYIKKHYTEEQAAILNKIYDVANQFDSYDRNAGDMGADYGDMTYFINICIGKWDKPYILN